VTSVENTGAAEGSAAQPTPRAELPSVVDVVIVGLGPVGATIANLLGRYGVRALAVDKATEIFMVPQA